MVENVVAGVIGVGVGILIGVSFGSKIRTEIKTGFDSLARTIESELGKLATAVKDRL